MLPEVRTKGFFAPILLAFAASIALFSFAVLFGAINQDEGWYLYAARMVARGEWPYRDFFFTQGPALPAVYGALHCLWGKFGVLGGRIVTALFSMLGGVLLAFAAKRSAGSRGGIFAWIATFAFTLCNLYHIYFTSIPKTYALSIFFIASGLLVLCNSEKRPFLAFFAGMLIAAAGTTRISMLFFLPPLAFGLLAWRRKLGLAWLWFGLGATLCVLCTHGICLLVANDQYIFAQTFHISRGGRDFMFMAGSLSRVVRGYLALSFAFVALIAFARGKGGIEARVPWEGMWFASALLVFLSQLASPHPYDDYQVPVVAVFAASISVWLARSLPENLHKPCAWACVLCTCLASFASPLAQEWFVLKQDRFWTLMKKQSDLAQLREVGAKIRKLAPNSGTLLTQDAYIAVEAGMDLPKGFEMGPFSYFPNEPYAAKQHVVDETGLLRIINETDAPVCAYSGYSWAIQSPVMMPTPGVVRRRFEEAISKRYDEVETVADFGQNKTTLRILVKKP